MYNCMDYRKIRYLFFTFGSENYSFSDKFFYADIGDCPEEEDDEVIELVNELDEKFPDLFDSDIDVIIAFVEVDVSDEVMFGIYALEDKTVILQNRNLKEAASFESYKEAILSFRQMLDKCDKKSA